MRAHLCLIVWVALLGFRCTEAGAADRPHNVVLFVPDGLRGEIVGRNTAPAMAALRARGVRFCKQPFLVPHLHHRERLCDGDRPPPRRHRRLLQHDLHGVPGSRGRELADALPRERPRARDVDEHFGGNYLNEETILRAAREAGLNTAAVGKLGPTLIFDHTERTGLKTVTIDDQTGSGKGIPLAGWVEEGLRSAGLDPKAPARGENGRAGDFKTPGTLVADSVQGDWFAAAVTKVLLPAFEKDDKPFVLVFWSRDPDGTQHNQGDSLLRLVPGINGPTSLASIRNADNDLARIQQALGDLGLADTTDIIVTSDHGFSTISKESATSPAAKASYPDTPPGLLPLGFVGIDLAKALGLPLWDPDVQNQRVANGSHPKFGNALIGADPTRPDVVVAVNGGSDLIYFPGERQPGRCGQGRASAARTGLRQRTFHRPQPGSFPAR